MSKLNSRLLQILTSRLQPLSVPSLFKKLKKLSFYKVFGTLGFRKLSFYKVFGALGVKKLKKAKVL